MNPYVEETTCDVCGGVCTVHARDVKFLYLDTFRHVNPQVCADLLRKQKELSKIVLQKKES